MPTAAQLLPERRTRNETISVARALGSTTRAEIFDHLRESRVPLTVRDIAAAFDLHPNVARTHLELLADADLVTVGRRKHPGGGRPAKVYAARSEPAASAIPRAGDDGAAASLVIRLLVELLEGRAASGPASSQAARAHEVAVLEGRRLVARLPRFEVPADQDRSPSARLETAARAAVGALRPYAPTVRIVRTGEDFVDIAGVGSALTPLADVRPALVEPMERGLLLGALAAGGAPVSLSEAPGGVGGERVLRARSATRVERGAPQPPSATVDARGGQREAGVVRAMRAITALRPGDVLEVLAEGPGAPAAFARWADRAGHQLLGVERATDGAGRPAIRLLIRKGS